MIRRAPRPEAGYLSIRNDVIRDDRLSFRARGLLAAMLSYPDDWQFSREWLADQSPREGVDAIRSALKELETHGYLTRQRVRMPGGRFGWEHLLFDTPQDTQPAPEPNEPDESRPPLVDKPPTAEPPVANPPSTEDCSTKTVDNPTGTERVPTCRSAPAGTRREGDDHTDDQEKTPPVGAPGPKAKRPDWRTQDRELFARLLDADPDDELWTEDGEPVTVAELYEQCRKRKPTPIRWPGRLLEGLYDRGQRYAVEDWLTGQGLSPFPDDEAEG